MVAGADRRPSDPSCECRAHPRRAGRDEVEQLIGPLGQGLDQLGDAGDADAGVGIGGDLDLGDRGQAAVDPRVGADHLDLEARHAMLADALDRMGDPVNRGGAVDDQAHPARLPLAGREPDPLSGEDRGRGHVRDRGNAGVEQRLSTRGEAPPIGCGPAERFDRFAQPRFRCARRARR